MITRNDRVRVAPSGRAFAGSQRWIQYYVNWHPDALNRVILTALPSLLEFKGALEWVSPLECEKFVEYRDEDFLRRLGAERHIADLRGFWPRKGPCWDALARVNNDSERGIVLIEAKSYPAEMLSSGCKASPASRAKIEQALTAAKGWIGAEPSSDWLGPLYQGANRLAHLYFFRELAGIPAWLVNVCFTGDPHSPTTLAEWQPALRETEVNLGLATVDTPFSATVFLEARERNP